MSDLEWARESQPWRPHAYQKKAVRFLLDHAAGALFLDPGLGKTSITLAAIKLLKSKHQVEKVLLVAPLRPCYSVWPEEILKWTDFKDLKVVVLHGPKKDQLLKEDADVYVINPEGLDWLLKATKTKGRNGKTSVSVDVRAFKKLGFDTLVVDELTLFKNTNSNRFKALKTVIPTFGRRWGLTGSPAANGLLGLFGQCYVLDEGRSLGKYITRYRAEYFKQHPDGFNWYPAEGAEERIYERLSPLVLRMSAEDYLELPELITNDIVVDLPDDVYRMYLEIEDDLITQIADKRIVASTAAAACLKCRQIANGGVYLDADIEALIKLPKSKREWVNLHTAKVDALADLINELQGSPLLVAYDFEHDLDRIREKLGKDIPYIGGGVSATRSRELEKMWNAGKLEVMLGHPQSIARGLNLQEVGNHICWHSLTYDYELFDQYIRRLLRQGNKAKKVFNHRIIAKGTIDRAIIGALGSKRKGQQALFDGLQQLAKRRRRK